MKEEFLERGRREVGKSWTKGMKIVVLVFLKSPFFVTKFSVQNIIYKILKLNISCD